ncbi:MAG: transcription termination/antitermination factor NusG [Planctomycetales bacterium 71-10]|nr:MAG: transcription termination/antitermination factor NusG [Planctomycetales bacterium 71-10]
MSHPTHENDESAPDPDSPKASLPADAIEVDEETPDGGTAAASPRASSPEPPDEVDEEPAAADDDDPPPDLVWYVLKVQSSREDSISEALQRRVRIQGLERYFGVTPEGKPRVVVPTEKITEIRNNKKRIVERKTYPGYIMVQMELNEKTWFLVRETPGVGDFVGAHGTPTKMTEAEVNQMLNQQEEQTTAKSPSYRIDVDRGDRVKIKDGPFENFEGTVEEVIEGRGLVKVMLIIFNRPTPVDLEHWQLERI